MANNVPRLNEEDIQSLVLDLVHNNIFVSTQVRRADELPMVFMPLAMGAFRGWTEVELKQVGVLYEHYDQAAPRSANGYPMFFGFHIVHAEDWKIVFDRYTAAMSAVEKAAGGPSA